MSELHPGTGTEPETGDDAAVVADAAQSAQDTLQGDLATKPVSGVDVSGNGRDTGMVVAEAEKTSQVIPRIGLKNLKPVRTSEQAAKMVNIRWEKYRRAVVAGIVGEAAASDPAIKDVYDAYGHLAAVQYQIASTPASTAGEARAATEAFKAVRQALGADIGAPSRSGSDAGTGGSGITISISGDVAERIAATLARAMADGRGETGE